MRKEAGRLWKYPMMLLIVLVFIMGSAYAQDSLWLGESKGSYFALKFGIGDDRLGGAKMGFLDSNVLLQIMDSLGPDYKVRLSANHTAYVNKDSVVLLRRIPNHAATHNLLLTGSVKVYGDTASDYVLIGLPARLPYHIYQEIDPSRIVIDVFGVNSNTNWLNQLKTAKEVKNAWYEQVEDDVFRVYVELKHVQHWGHGAWYDTSGKRLVVRIKRPPPVMDIRNLRIAIDAGHGGENQGTSGVRTGILEKNYTLLVARELEGVLKKAGARHVFMTRTKDTTLSMVERMDMLKTFNPDFLVSIHLNSAGSDTVEGVSTYYRYIGFRPLSQALLNQLLMLNLREFGNIGHFNFALSGPTEYPNALVELAFLSNPADERKVLNAGFRKAAAQKIFSGIQSWLKSAH